MHGKSGDFKAVWLAIAHPLDGLSLLRGKRDRFHNLSVCINFITQKLHLLDNIPWLQATN
jgi:hypothetical protein